MFCSIIIPTVGRSSLANSVHSALEQNFSHHDYEIIVVNDTGDPLPVAEWQLSDNVQVITTQKRERCFARNVGAAIAKGEYLCFLDDDDWLLPNALHNLWKAVQAIPDASWIYGGVRFVDGTGKTLGYLNQGKTGNCFLEAMTETWIPLQSSLIKSDTFFQIGGFDPEFVVTQDLDLLRRIALHEDLISIPDNIACIRRGGERNTETKYSIGWCYIAYGRDRLLAKTETLPRLLDSAGESAFLHGLVFRNYISSVLFNVRQHHWSNVINRLSLGLFSFFKSIPFAFSKEYWRAIRLARPLHVSAIKEPSSDYDSIEEWLFS